MKEKLTISVEKTTLDRYRDLIKPHGMKVSPRIETLIEKDIVVIQQINTTKGR